jgi:hypothetical protein
MSRLFLSRNIEDGNQVDALFDLADADGDGTLDYAEFVARLMQQPAAAAGGGGGGESFLRVHWVAVPEALCARRVNRRPQRAAPLGAAAGAGAGGGRRPPADAEGGVPGIS